MYSSCSSDVIGSAGFLNMKEEDWDWCNDINYNSIINFSRSFLPHLMKDEETALINTSSIFGIITTPNNTVYHASKFAVRGFTESLIKEMEGSNTQIHCVYPGLIGTNIAVNAKVKNISMLNKFRLKLNILIFKSLNSNFYITTFNEEKVKDFL